MKAYNLKAILTELRESHGDIDWDEYEYKTRKAQKYLFEEAIKKAKLNSKYEDLTLEEDFRDIKEKIEKETYNLFLTPTKKMKE